MLDKTEEFASKHLGQKSLGSETYEPTLLVPIPRIENRKQYDINNSELPFEGYDIWHGYEFSSMTNNNVPITRLIKIKYNCNSEFLVESKSLKLYLNSFNMTKFGNSIEDCLDICKKLIEKDLSNTLKTPVKIEFIDNTTPKIEIFDEYINLIKLVNEKDLVISQFKESPEVLEIDTINFEPRAFRLTFDSLRSNCRVTHQPDFGDVFIYYNSKKHINEISLIKYLVSFRSEYHFHEECCEMIFKRLMDLLDEQDELFVGALYTRRGGIDICPVRWSKNCSIRDFEPLLSLNIFARNGVKQ